ncbi:MAG TPA: carboxymuconolactone decarboxylase family protein [Verrucomicrobiae bacterium]|nr:carboxymuconolactone decarboxylase family protein [Verrucomicrobiae bacterium]
MPHITLPPDLPGIMGPMAQYPETGAALSGLAQVLLRGPSSLTPEEREIIAAYVSQGNGCRFCSDSHAAAARSLSPEGIPSVDQVLDSMGMHGATPKLLSLLALADRVRVSGKQVDEESVASARANGASDDDIHHTVLIAAAFCMFNRYVDGLGTVPAPEEAYVAMGDRLAQHGYLPSSVAVG